MYAFKSFVFSSTFFVLALFLSLTESQTQTTCPLNFFDSFCETCNSDATYCQTCAKDYYPHDTTGECTRVRSGEEIPKNMINNVKTIKRVIKQFPQWENGNFEYIQFMDPYCVSDMNVVFDVEKDGSCTGCIAFPKINSGPATTQISRYLGDDKLTCHTSCDYSATGKFGIGQGQAAVCQSCRNNCLKCSDSTNCKECIYSKQRMQGSININNFLTASEAGTLTCDDDRNPTTKSLVYYVGPAGSAKRCGSCSNSNDLILWDDLNMVFKDIITASSNYIAVDVKIYLLKDGSNLIHYLLDTDTEANFYSYNYMTGNLGHLPRPFERTIASVYIGPIYCSQSPTQTGCLADGEKPIIKWKSSMAHLYVTSDFLIENVIIDGADMTPGNINNQNTCFTTRKECCIYDSATSTTTQNQTPSSCDISNSLYSDWNVDETTGRQYGLFVFEYMRDNPNTPIPSLTMKNCEVKNFFYSKYHTSFIQMSSLAGNLVIEDSSFSRFFFPHGLISNSQTPLDRNLFEYSSFHGETCRHLQNPDVANCHSIMLKHSTFKEYNPFKTKNSGQETSYTVEGAVLAVHNLDGPITVQGCNFESFLAYNGISTSSNQQFDCFDYDAKSWGPTPPSDILTHAVNPRSKYKVYLDKHFRKYMENENTKRSTTAVLHLRNITKGVVIHDNTFEKIYTTVGGAVYIEGFNNTFGAPIILSSNIFTNNFAQLMGANIFIYKRSPNVPRLNCTGIWIEQNSFTNNFGCSMSIGNVVLACEATDYSVHSGVSGGETALATYYTTYSVTSNHNFEQDTYSYRNFTRYLKKLSKEKDIPYHYQHPLNSSASFNPGKVVISNNFFGLNIFKLSNGFYIQGVMNLLLQANTFSENSIPREESYTLPQFQNNAFTLTGSSAPTFPSNDTTMRESVPVIIRQSNYIQANENVFSKNTAGFYGGDYYLAQSITFHQLIGQDGVTIFKNTFKDHQGFDTSDEMEYPLYASTPLIAFNFWELTEVYLKGLDEDGDGVVDTNPPNTFVVDACTFEENRFNFNVEADVKFYYHFKNDKNVYSNFQSPFGHLLKYFSHEEVISHPDVFEVAFTSPVSESSGPPMTALHVTVKNSHVKNNEFANGFCAFNSFWFNRFEILTTTFEGNTVADAKNRHAMICIGKDEAYSRFNSGSTILVDDVTFLEDHGVLFYLGAVGSKDPNSAETYVTNLNTIAMEQTKTTDYAPIYANSATSVSMKKIDAKTVEAMYGLLYLNYSSEVVVDKVDVNGLLANHTGLIFARSMSSTLISNLTTAQNTFLITDAMDKNFDTSGFTGREISSLENFETVLTLVKQIGGSLKIQDSKFSNGNFVMGFAVSGGSLELTNFEASHLTLRDSLIFSMSKATITIINSNFNHISGGSYLLAGVLLADSSTFISRNSNYSDISTQGYGLVQSQMSKITLENIRVTRLQASKQIIVLGAKLGDVKISGSYFGLNHGTHSDAPATASISVLFGTLKIDSTTFDRNFAYSGTHNIQATKLLETGTITNSHFISRASTAEEQTNQAHARSDFIVVEESSLLVQDTKFENAALNAILSNSKTFTLALNNVTVRNSACSIGCLDVTGTLSILNSLFESTKFAVNLQTDNLIVRNTIFRQEKDLSLSVQCFDSEVADVVIDNVTFDGTPNAKLWDISKDRDPADDQEAVSILSCQKIMITNSIFKNFRTSVNGAALGITLDDLSTNKYEITISSSKFQNNLALSGGCAFLENIGQGDVIINIDNTEFDHCVAVDRGGGIFFNNFESILKTSETTSEDDNYFNLNDNVVFQNCRAGYAGGGIYYGQMRPNIDSKLSSGHVFKDNYAPYGPSIASYPTKISISQISDDPAPSSKGRILADSDSNKPKITLVSGQAPNPPIRINLIDMDDQLVSNWNNSVLNLDIKSQNVKARSRTEFLSTNGIFSLDQLILDFSPGKSTNMTLISSISIYFDDQVVHSFAIELDINGTFRNCTAGERLTDGDQCQVCPSGKALFAVNSRDQCMDCPDNMDCLEGEKIGPVKNYWRFSKWNDNSVKCFNDEACLGHTVEATETEGLVCKENYNSTFCLTGWCSNNYQGNLCATCKPGYAKSNDIYCVACNNNPLYYIIAAVIVIAAVGFIIFTVRNALKVKDFEKEGGTAITSILLKIFMNYIQLISIVGSFNFEWPSQVSEMFNVQSKVSSNSVTIFSFDCLLPNSETVKPFFSKLLMISVSPALLALMAFIIWKIIYIIKKNFSRGSFKSTFITTFVVLLFMIHTTVVHTSILGFRCINIGDEETDETEQYLARELDVKCWESTHLLWAFSVALPSFLLWGVGFPLFAFRILKINQKNLDAVDFRSKFGFLYDGYKKEKYYWEFVILYRKITMIFISVFLATFGITIQALAVLGVSFLSFLLQFRSKPFQDDRLNSMEKKALICATVTLYCGLYYITEELSSAVNTILMVVIILANAIFCVSWLLFFLRESKKVIVTQMTKLSRKNGLRTLKTFFTRTSETEEKSDKTEKSEKSEEKDPADNNQPLETEADRILRLQTSLTNSFSCARMPTDESNRSIKLEYMEPNHASYVFNGRKVSEDVPSEASFPRIKLEWAIPNHASDVFDDKKRTRSESGKEVDDEEEEFENDYDDEENEYEEESEDQKEGKSEDEDDEEEEEEEEIQSENGSDDQHQAGENKEDEENKIA